MDLTAFGLTDSELDQIVLFWHGGDLRRAVVTWDYGSASDYLTRLLGLLGGSWVEQSVASQLSRLREAGTAIVVSVRGHRLGLMRPKLLGSVEAINAADPPFLIAVEVSRYRIELPVLAPGREDAVRLVRRLDEAAVADKGAWRGYVCERQRSAWERVVLRAVGRTVTTHHTELERLMLANLHAPPRRPKKSVKKAA